MNNANGSVFKYPDNVDTDVIIPARYLNTQNAKELAAHCMEDIDKDFINKVKEGDIMVGGWNFGCGSSREHAPLAIKAAGISVVIAKSFARIFYRNSINIGLPIMECPEAVDAIHAGDNVTVDFDTGVITDVTTGKVFQAEPFPPFIREIIEERGRVMEALRTLPGVTAYPSDSNWILFSMEDAGAAWQYLYDRGVLVRDFSSAPTLEGCLRATIGTPEQNDAFIRGLRDFLAESRAQRARAMQ